MRERSPISSEDTPTVAVIIPYSGEYTPREMLHEAVESAASQVNVDTEIVVVEDEDQRGPAWARNQGLDRVDRRYVAFLDADDRWKETKLEQQLTKMASTGAGLCVDGKRRKSPMEFARALVTSETLRITSTILIDTEKLDVRFEESLERHEDHLFMIEAAMTAGVCFSTDTYTERVIEDGLSNRVGYSPAEIDAFFDRLVERVPEAARLEDVYYQDAYVDLGRRRHAACQYRGAIEAYRESLSYGPTVKAVGALGLTLLKFLYEYPTRPARRLVAEAR